MINIKSFADGEEKSFAKLFFFDENMLYEMRQNVPGYIRCEMTPI